jgi:hypothetical protein
MPESKVKEECGKIRSTEDITIKQIINGISLFVSDNDESIYFNTDRPNFDLFDVSVIGMRSCLGPWQVIDFGIYLTRGKIWQVYLLIHEGRSIQNRNKKTTTLR